MYVSQDSTSTPLTAVKKGLSESCANNPLSVWMAFPAVKFSLAAATELAGSAAAPFGSIDLEAIAAASFPNIGVPVQL